MIKKLITGLGVSALVLGQSVAATAAPAERVAAPVSQSEKLGGEGGISTTLLIALFAIVGAGIILLIEDKEDGVDLPSSP